VRAVLGPRFEREHMLAAAEVDVADDVRASVQRDLVVDARQVVEDQPAGCHELAVFVRVVDAGHGAACHLRGRPTWHRMPAATIAGTFAAGSPLRFLSRVFFLRPAGRVVSL
jgi:hypothetical protein